MSEFHMAGAHSQQAYTAQYRQPAPNVEWYAPQATSNSNFASSYAFDQGFAANSGAAYGSFDEEPPLLEGARPALGSVPLGHPLLRQSSHGPR